MNRVSKLLLALAALAAAFSAHAEGGQVGFVDIDRIFQQSHSGQQSRSALDQEAAGFNRELDKISETARKLQEDLEKNALTLSDSERTQRERRLEELRAQFESRKEAFTQEFGQHRNQAINAMLKRIEEVVAKIAQREQLELVVARAVSVSGSADITDKVIQSLDASVAQANP